MVNLELYKVFYTVAKCGSLTKAAEELYITQPAVSQAIKQLETQLGMPLFNRMRKGVELSAQGGELVYPDVERALQLLVGVEDKLSELKDKATGTLRIGATEMVFKYYLADSIVKFHELCPQVKLELLTDFTAKTIENLKIDRCDVGFLNLPIEEDKNIVLTDTLILLNDVFFAGESYSELRKKRLNVWELQHYPIILLQENTVSRELFDRYCQSLGAKLSPTVEVDSFGLMKRLVAEGMGIGCIPREYITHSPEDDIFFELDVTPQLPSRSVGMAVSKNSAMSFALRSFINMVRRK